MGVSKICITIQGNVPFFSVISPVVIDITTRRERQLHEIAYLQFPGLVWQTLVPALYTAWNLRRQHISTYIAAGPPGSSTAQPSTHYGGRCFGNQVSDSDDVVSAPVCCYTKWCSSGSRYLCYPQPAFGFNGFHYANRPTVLFYWWYVV